MAKKPSKLKPCPCTCGRKAEEGEALMASGQRYPLVGCRWCQVIFVRRTRAAVYRAWNRGHRG